MTFVEKEIKRLRDKEAKVGLDVEEYESLAEYEGRQQSIDWEHDYLNGEVH